MPKYHLNPEQGPLPCSAREGKCHYGPTAPHFRDIETANLAFAELMSKEVDPLAGLRRAEDSVRDAVKPMTANKISNKMQVVKKMYTPELRALEEELIDQGFPGAIMYAEESPETFAKLNELINVRASASPRVYAQMRNYDPRNDDASNPLSRKGFDLLEKSWRDHRNNTAMLVEAYQDSGFYKSKARELPDDVQVGYSKKLKAIAYSDPEWHLNRFDTVGGSDVSAVVIQDFIPEADRSSLEALTVRKVESSKITQLTDADVYKRINADASRNGPLYRGHVWEQRIRDSFVEDNPRYTVYETDAQFAHPEREWQRANFDAILSSRPDGKPDGILEIKTGGDPDVWKQGIPVAYRAQTLYYLNTTGLDYAKVRVVLNDGETRDYTLHKNDDVVPNCGMNMETYVKNRVADWFDALKAKR